jgi:hypothetical protein
MPDLKTNIITNTDSMGLWRDVCVLREALESVGARVHIINNYSDSVDTVGKGADISIFVESLHRADLYLNHAHTNWFKPNLDWYFPDQYDRHLPMISLILCKTKHAYDIWSERVGSDRCLYTGFTSLDMYRRDTQKIDAFIHTIGKSQVKGTDKVAEAWRHMSYPLTVVTRAQTQAEAQVTRQLTQLFNGNRAIRHLHNLTDDQLAEELSLHRFFILPSLSEGWGQAMNEAFSAKCVVMTTDAPPMNEFGSIHPAMLIPVINRQKRMLTSFNYCSGDGVRRVVESAVRMRTDYLDEIGNKARAEWESGRAYFRHTFTDAVQRWGEWI